MDDAELRERGRRSYARCQWGECFEDLSAVAALAGAPLEPGDLERLAIAAYLTGRDDESSDAWALAHQAWLDRDGHAQAVRCAFWAGFGLMQRGKGAQGGGWLARGATLANHHRLDGPERGYLLLPEALMAMGGGDHGTALDLFGEASAIAQRFDDRDLAALGAIGRGGALLGSGHVHDGMRSFDEAMVSVTAGETSPVVSGIVYCAVINDCQQVFDLRRAREWTVELDRWCAGQHGLVPYRGQCLVHRAQILQMGGQWAEAMTEAHRACERLAEPPHPAIGMAHYELAELHRLTGRIADAETGYRRAHSAGRQPYPGLALLRLTQGRFDDAVAGIEQALVDAPGSGSRARLLAAAVEIMLAAERTTDARRAADELAGMASDAQIGLLDAVAAHARGAVLLAEGDPRAALEALQGALRAWQDVDAPYETARVRVAIAMACRAIGDRDSAELECDAARAALERLGAGPELARLDELVAQHTRRGTRTVTARELEVLRLVAAGRTNREIAKALGISERTVERHLGNIFRKLDVPNRAAATAHAYDHGLM